VIRVAGCSIRIVLQKAEPGGGENAPSVFGDAHVLDPTASVARARPPRPRSAGPVAAFTSSGMASRRSSSVWIAPFRLSIVSIVSDSPSAAS